MSTPSVLNATRRHPSESHPGRLVGSLSPIVLIQLSTVDFLGYQLTVVKSIIEPESLRNDIWWGGASPITVVFVGIHEPGSSITGG